MKVKTAIKAARAAAQKQISDHASHGRIAAGLASEGYNGGYRDALDDVLLLLNGTLPSRHGFWNEPNREPLTGKGKP